MYLKYEKITEDIIGAAFEVYNILGYGFLEKVYQRALQVEILKRGHSAELEYQIKVNFKGVIVGEFTDCVKTNNYVILRSETTKNL